MDVDLYEFKKVLNQVSEDDEAVMEWIEEHGRPKDAFVIDANEAPESVKEVLRAMEEPIDHIVIVLND